MATRQVASMLGLLVASLATGCATETHSNYTRLIVVSADPGVRVSSVRYGHCQHYGRSCNFVALQTCTRLPCDMTSSSSGSSIEIRGDDGESRHSLPAFDQDARIRIHRSVPNRLVPALIGTGLGAVPAGFLVAMTGMAGGGDLIHPTLATRVVGAGIGIMASGALAWIGAIAMLGSNARVRMTIEPNQTGVAVEPIGGGALVEYSGRF